MRHTTYLGVLVALVLSLGVQEAQASQSQGRHCGTVVVHFGHGSEGGANKIRAKGIECGPARDVARACVENNKVPGWTAVNWGIRTELHQGGMAVTFIQVGGGGCGLYAHPCKAFDYRDIVIGKILTVGLRCEGREGASATARAWYDVGGSCRLGSTCRLGDFRCVGTRETGVVACTRQNGFRVRWEITGDI